MAGADGGARQLTTLRGWREFAAARPAVPDLLPEPAWKLLDDDGRLGYDDARLAHHARLLTVATSTIQQVITEGRRLQYLNRHADAGRCGLILSGPARTGKTTCLAQLGKTIETMHHRRNPHAAGHIPVIYITAPPAATPQDDRGRVRPVPRPAADPPLQRHRRAGGSLRRLPGRRHHPGLRRLYRPLPQLFLMSVRLACRDVP